MLRGFQEWGVNLLQQPSKMPAGPRSCTTDHSGVQGSRKHLLVQTGYQQKKKLISKSIRHSSVLKENYQHVFVYVRQIVNLWVLLCQQHCRSLLKDKSQKLIGICLNKWQRERKNTSPETTHVEDQGRNALQCSIVTSTMIHIKCQRCLFLILSARK